MSKRLKLAEEEGREYIYHNNNRCFKWYTHSQKLKIIEERKEAQDIAEKLSVDSTYMMRHSSTIPRERANLDIDPKLLKCTICGSNCIQVNKKMHMGKYRISERNSAEKFLQAARHLKNSVFGRVAELNTPEDVFAADLYCYSVCMKRYLHKYDPNLEESADPVTMDTSHTSTEMKYVLFLRALDHIDPLLRKAMDSLLQISTAICVT